ncbi:hypothetical protein Patl1_08250 [Pistacia atlantica]|uniref:Uncharacterized protein n=1 Tax=Pistacia atlantica TaxID=434234 RepID=A0ACC1AIQ0_9ROSI|nr:hypothetical protein Patl1_08250 [Pistacia atlantica]
MDQLKPNLVNSCPLTPVTFLARAATVYGDYPSLVYNTTAYTWTQTYRRCLQLASSLSSLGIKTGHVVSVVAPNIPPMYELHFALPMSGAILNTINTRLDARTVSSILQHSESKLVFLDHILSSLILEAVSLFPPNTETPRLVLVNDEDTSASTLIGFIDTYENMVKKGNSEFKGLFIATVTSLIDWSVSNQPVYLWTLPMFHGNWWCYTWGMAAVGATNICLLLNMLSNNRNAERIEHPVHILTGGAPPPAPVLFRIESLGFMVSHCYGLTETCSLVFSCAWKPQWNKLHATERSRLMARQGVGTIGLTQLDVVDPKSGVSVQRDGLACGELVLRGGSLMLGYLKDPKTTSKCMKDNGWFYTGDVAVMHPDGYVEIKDRSKDVIISGGENISSAQVESVLYSHRGSTGPVLAGDAMRFCMFEE